MEVMKFENSKKEALFGYHFGCDNPCARIFILEGMEEHGKRYEDFARALNEYHFDVYVVDVYGQGENVVQGAPKGVWPVDGFNKFVCFVSDVIESFNNENLETYVFAHSMGSFMGQRLLEVSPKLINKIVLCGSGCKNPALGIGRCLAKATTKPATRNNKAGLIAKIMFGGFNKKIKHPKTEYDWLSVNEENVKNYIADPLCGYGPNKGFCLDFINGMIDIYKTENLKKLDKNTKIFIIAGQDDPVTSYGKAVDKLTKMYNKYGLYNISSKIYPNHRHELLNESDRESIYDDIVHFFLS